MILSKLILKKTYDVCIIHCADARFYPFFHRQAKALTEQGLRVALVSWENRAGQGDPKWPGIDVYPIFIPSKSIRGAYFFIRYFFSLIAVLLGLKARLYEAVDPPALVPARIAAWRHRARYNYFSLEYFQGIDELVTRPVMRRVWRLIEQAGIARVRNVAAVCGTTEQLLKKDYNLAKTATVLNVPEKSEYAAAGDGRFRTRLGVAAGVPLIVYKGDIAENRGLLAFLHAMVPFEALTCALVGGGAYRDTLKVAAKELGIAARTFFVDPVPSDEFAYVLKDADAGQVLHEGLGINMAITLPSKLFDYINAGIPVIAGDGPEISRIVTEWNIGWVVRPSSRESIQKGIADFLGVFPGLAVYKRNCARAAERYCWNIEKKTYLDFMRDALDGEDARS